MWHQRQQLRIEVELLECTKAVQNQMEGKERRSKGQKETGNLRNFSFISGNGFQFFPAQKHDPETENGTFRDTGRE